jgi:hypothetical protein
LGGPLQKPNSAPPLVDPSLHQHSSQSCTVIQFYQDLDERVSVLKIKASSHHPRDKDLIYQLVLPLNPTEGRTPYRANCRPADRHLAAPVSGLH